MQKETIDYQILLPAVQFSRGSPLPLVIGILGNSSPKAIRISNTEGGGFSGEILHLPEVPTSNRMVFNILHRLCLCDQFRGLYWIQPLAQCLDQ